MPDPADPTGSNGNIPALGQPLIDTLPHGAETWVAGVVDDIVRLDKAVYGIIADTPTPHLDGPLRELSSLANHSKISFSIAGVLALVGGRTGRRGAIAGVTAIGAASLIANVAIKPFAKRRRPDRDGEDVPDVREVPMPTSTSFPSGHSASAYAFASAVSDEIPLLGAPLLTLAASVAYSRVHTGVHYPSDVIIGATIGATIGNLTTMVLRSAKRRRITRAVAEVA